MGAGAVWFLFVSLFVWRVVWAGLLHALLRACVCVCVCVCACVWRLWVWWFGGLVVMCGWLGSIKIYIPTWLGINGNWGGERQEQPRAMGIGGNNGVLGVLGW